MRYDNGLGRIEMDVVERGFGRRGTVEGWDKTCARMMHPDAACDELMFGIIGQ